MKRCSRLMMTVAEGFVLGHRLPPLVSYLMQGSAARTRMCVHICGLRYDRTTRCAIALLYLCGVCNCCCWHKAVFEAVFAVVLRSLLARCWYYSGANVASVCAYWRRLNACRSMEIGRAVHSVVLCVSEISRRDYIDGLVLPGWSVVRPSAIDRKSVV